MRTLLLIQTKNRKGITTMCVSAQPADFRGTRILLNYTRHPKHGQILVLGYQNTAVNKNQNGPNALLLHLPAMPLTPEHFIDTEGCRGIFDDMIAAVNPSPIQSKGMLRCSMALTPVVFEHGIYTVVLAADARDIPKALERVPARKRPVISEELCEFYANYRPGWPIALCCFDNADEKQADPVFLWYKPMNPNVLVAPGIDCHSGGVPDLSEKVHVDHFLFLASDKMHAGTDVHYGNAITRQKMDGFLPRRVVGFNLRGHVQNGDFAVMHSRLVSGMSQQDIRRPGVENPLALHG